LLAESYTVYVNQTNLNGKKMGGQTGSQPKIWGGAWPTQAPLRIATVKQVDTL